MNEPPTKLPNNTAQLKKALSRLSSNAYIRFAFEMCGRSDSDDEAHWITQAGAGVFYQPLLDSYAGTLHSVFLVHYLPKDLFVSHEAFSVDDPELKQRVQRVRQIYKGQTGYFGMVSPELKRAQKLQSVAFLNNVIGWSKQSYEQTIIPAYEKLARRHGIRVPLFVGSPDSFIDLNRESARDAFFKFLGQDHDGIRISIEATGPSVQHFSSESPLGVVGDNFLNPLEPVFPSALVHRQSLDAEFESLLQAKPSEELLEKFVAANFKEIFGPEYDRIETQLWLRCPELDFGGKDRRLDVFLRNSVLGDWELLELKRVIPLTQSFRDIPVFCAEVNRAIQQAAYYAKLLKEDQVKRKFAAMGIEYFEPSVSLVIGRKPQIPHAQWRWLTAQKNHEVKLVTYDDLLGLLRCRLKERSL